ncbi:MAG TPA: tetratricopeptide repeat protein [candidate division Zixibacteria bacterium]|nr:tetratricopeptide repeat protein [candidate division Zixibacteria bacterium]
MKKTGTTIRSHHRRLLILSVLTLVIAMPAYNSGCVYFNTFYNARKNFNEAESERKNAEKRGTRRRANSAKYNKAIEKASVVLEKHPDSKYYDDALFIIGVSYYWLEEHFKSERKFRELLANFQNSDYADRSKLYLAKCKLALDERAEAVTIFQSLLGTVKDATIRAEAAFAIGDYYFEQKEYDNSALYYQALLDSLAVTDTERRVALLGIADGLFARFDIGGARATYQRALKMKLDDNEEYHARFRIGECSFLLQDIDGGMEMFNKLASDERYFDSVGVVRLQIARGYEMDDDLVLAEEEYENIAVQADRTPASGAALYNLGLIYQFDYQDLDRALEYYQEANKKGKNFNPYYEESVKRAADIGALATLRNQTEEQALDESADEETKSETNSEVPADSTQNASADTAAVVELTELERLEQQAVDSALAQERIDDASEAYLRLGELYLFDLNQPDSAIAAFQYAVDSLAGGYFAPRAMLSLALAKRDYLDDTAAFESIGRELLQRYPRSDFYPEALAALGLTGSAADTGYAASYIAEAERLLLEEGNLDSARSLYQLVADSFPQSSFAPQAEFSVIWLTEQFENPGDDSTFYYRYKELADLYPESEYAKLARAEITVDSRPRPAAQQRRDEPNEVDSLAADTAAADTVADSSSVKDDCNPFEKDELQFNPELRYYIGPDCEQIWDAPGAPTARNVIDYIYPSTAVDMPDFFDLYFQVKLELDGSVLEAVLMNPTQYPELNEARKEQIENYIFDMGKLGSLGYGSGWFVYKDKNEKPDYLR